MSFLRFVFTGVYNKEPGSSLPVREDTLVLCPGTPPALRGPLVRQPSSPAMPSAPGACPASPTMQLGDTHLQVLGNWGSDAFTPPTPPKEWVLKALLPSLPRPACCPRSPWAPPPPPGAEPAAGARKATKFQMFLQDAGLRSMSAPGPSGQPHR